MPRPKVIFCQAWVGEAILICYIRPTFLCNKNNQKQNKKQITTKTHKNENNSVDVNCNNSYQEKIQVELLPGELILTKRDVKRLRKCLSTLHEVLDAIPNVSEITHRRKPTLAELFDSVEPQSGEHKISLQETDDKQQTLQYHHAVQEYHTTVESDHDSTRDFQFTEDVTLQKFFERPIKIREFDWGVAGSIIESFNPWTDFMTNKRVINRITNYNLLQCDLHVRFVINGNPFYYGKALAYYVPLASLNSIPRDRALIKEDLVAGSQCPKVFIDPTTSMGGELHLPFFYHKNAMSVVAANWQEMGNIYVRTLNTLKHANGALDPLTVTVMAHATNVKLSMPTTANPASIVPQNGEIEEATTGFISGPATTVAKIAGALKVIPWLKPYAMASEMIATGTAQFAKIFGYSRPANVAQPIQYSHTPISSLALTNVPDNSQKITVDAKQELTIDPAISGIRTPDPLNIRGIAQRESWLTTFDWNRGTSTDSLLWNTVVEPTLWAESVFNGKRAIHLPAMAVAAIPFRYWSGSINFRFQVVCSNFHKGRLRVTWDPATSGNTEYNTAFQKIVDISTERDFSISIANGQTTSLLTRHDPATTILANVYSTSQIGTPSVGNGVLSVRIFNALTVPNDTIDNDISINVFVSAGDDFEVYNPCADYSHYVFAPQAGELSTTEDDTEESSAPEQKLVSPMNSVTTADMHNMVFTGESVASFRPLLKRFNHHMSITRDSIENANYFLYKASSFPYFRGNVPGAVGTSPTGGYNFCNTVLLHWMHAPFAAWRGSMRWKFIPTFGLNSFLLNQYATRADVDDPNTYSEFAASYSPATSAEGQREALEPYAEALGQRPAIPQGALGSAYNNSTNGVLEVEIPWYSRYRFIPYKTLNLTGINTPLIRAAAFVYKVFYWRSNQYFSVSTHVAAGDDFQTYFWVGMPPIYYEDDFPQYV